MSLYEHESLWVAYYRQLAADARREGSVERHLWALTMARKCAILRDAVAPC